MKKIIKGALPQTSTRAYQKIEEEYTLVHAILEIIQNAIEHGNAPLCRIKYWVDEKGDSHISFFNNGRTMTDSQFLKFSTEYHCHDITNSTPSSNGVFTSLKGYGLKDAVVFCSAEHGVSTVVFRNFHKNGRVTEWQWKICKNDGDNGSYDGTIREYDYDIMSQPSGFEICISNSRKFTEAQFQNAQRNIAKTFSSEMIAENRTIHLIWKDKNLSKTVLYDPMHFEQIPLPEGKTIYNCEVGEYISDDVIWFVNESIYKGKHPYNEEYVEVPVRTVVAYFNQPTYTKKYPVTKNYDKIGSPEAGVFPLFGQVYLETGNNMRRHFGGADNCGGAARYRICPIITNENAFLWGVKSIKNSGITPFTSNYLLCEEFKEVKPDGTMGKTIFESLLDCYANVKRFHKEKITVKKGEPNYYAKNGFSDRERILKDISDFKNGITTSNEVNNYSPVIVPDNANDVLYTLNTKNGIIRKELTEDGMKHSLNIGAIKDNYNNATKEDIIFSVFDTLQEMGVDPSICVRLNDLLSKKVCHYED